MPTTAPNPAELAAIAKGIVSEYAEYGDIPRLHELIDQLRDLASGPSAEVGAGPWTVTGPDHPVFRGESPLKAAMEAQRYRRQTDPVEAEKFLAAVESIRKEGEEEDKRLIALHGSLDCPACGGSGHVGDTNLASLSAASSGADVLKADLPGWIAYLREAHDDSLDGNESDARSNILSAVSLMESALLAAPAATPPAEKEVRVPLTDEQIAAGWEELLRTPRVPLPLFKHGVRWAERAHGISAAALSTDGGGHER
jgi:hypothetical protein